VVKVNNLGYHIQLYESSYSRTYLQIERPTKKDKVIRVFHLITRPTSTYKGAIVTIFILWLILCTILANISPILIWEQSLVPLVLISTGMISLFFTQIRAIWMTNRSLNSESPDESIFDRDISIYLILPLSSTKLGYLLTVILLAIAPSWQYPTHHPDFSDLIISNVIGNLFNGIGCLGLLVVAWVSLETSLSRSHTFHKRWYHIEIQNDKLHLTGAGLAFGMFILYQVLQTSANLVNLFIHQIVPSVLWYPTVLIFFQLVVNIITMGTSVHWVFKKKSKSEWIAAFMIGLYYFLASFLTAFVHLHFGEGENL
jgi:hypothetical protein